MLGSFLYLAQDLYVQPATQNARDIKGLFNITLAIALVVFVLVEGLLLYMVIRFRNNRKVPREEGHRGHTTAEVVWTVIPAAILLFLGFLSAGTLIHLDTVPDDTDFTIHIEARQFIWRFIYPDDNGVEYNGEADWCRAPNQARCSFNDLRLQEGSTVKFTATGLDVIHAFAVPEFGIKADAVPGKTHTAWFQVPSLNGASEATYFVQCMEYCGVGHHLMGPSKEASDAGSVPHITVFPAGAQPLAWGKPAAEAPPAAPTP
ncbi:MAG TPA: cytochrome c oxidase subunit II [Candidatus Thermoplasmatota archaeon]|nr:cytochrome c oxidase subunit II [Candidatus Thermoplasmatota archaeon]